MINKLGAIHVGKYLLAILVVSGWAFPAAALPPVPLYMNKALAENRDATEFVKSLVLTTEQCFVCHTNGDKKKKGHALNDFGRAYHKHFDDKGFKAAHKDKNSVEAEKLFKEAWLETMMDKNADGKTFGELLKAGGPLGKNEEGAKNEAPNKAE